MIEKLLQLEPLDRLGAAGTGHGMDALMAHPFFKGIDFKSDLTKLGIRQMLEESELKELAKFANREASKTELPGARFAIIEDGKPMLSGILLKRNKWRMKQERTFHLYPSGEIKYFKDKEQKGTIKLTKGSKVFKISRSEIEVVLPQNNKNYVLIQYDVKKCPPVSDRYSCVLDDWVEAIKQVIA